MNIIKATKILSLFLIVSLLIFYYKKQNMEKFDWMPTRSTPTLYPVYVTNGAFFKGETSIATIYGTDEDGVWGDRSTSTEVLGDVNRQVPDGLGIEWFSITEGKSYTGSFDLPADTITHLFREGFTLFRQKAPGTYRDFIVGMAPGGIVNVWLSGRGKSVEIGCFRAEETDIDIRPFFPFSKRKDMDPDEALTSFRESYLEPEVQKNMKERGIPKDLWSKTFRERFLFRVRVEYKDEKAIIDEVQVKFVNGEMETLSMEALEANIFAKRARPRFLDIYWSSERKLKHTEIYIDEYEIVEAYARVYKYPEVQECELVVRVNQKNDHIRLFLKGIGTEDLLEIELDKSKIRIYDLDAHHMRSYTAFRDEYESQDGGYSWKRKDGK